MNRLFSISPTCPDVRGSARRVSLIVFLPSSDTGAGGTGCHFYGRGCQADAARDWPGRILVHTNKLDPRSAEKRRTIPIPWWIADTRPVSRGGLEVGGGLEHGTIPFIPALPDDFSQAGSCKGFGTRAYRSPNRRWGRVKRTFPRTDTLMTEAFSPHWVSYVCNSRIRSIRIQPIRFIPKCPLGLFASAFPGGLR